MSLDAARAAILRAAEELRVAHAEALGAMEAELHRVDEDGKAERPKVEASGRRELAIAQTKASNAVMAAKSKVHDRVLSLTTGAGSDSLRVARVVELGELLLNAKRAGIHSQMDVPLLVPLLGAGNITVIGDSAEAASLVRNIQLEALRGTAPGQLALAAFDPRLTNPLAPFAKLADAGDGLVRSIQSAKDLDNLIDELTATVARVGDILLGGSGGLAEHRDETGKQVERFHLVSLHDYPEAVAEQQHSRLLTLARAAARHGIAFLFHVPQPKALPSWLDLEELKSLGDAFDVTSSRAIWARNPQLNAALPEVTPREVTSAVASVVAAAEQSSKVELRSLLPTNEWTESSIEGLSIDLAQGAGGPLRVTFGDDMPHGLITGSSGSGKSNLLKLLIYGIAARYSPDEVELYLLDMKEGVTLAPMAPSTGSGTYLPHARVIGLQADQEFGLSVLQEIERLHKRRIAAMSPMDNIKDYREAHPDARIPRVLVVIDEFHLLLADDENRVGREAAAKLLALAKLVRAAGIHIVVATQEIGSIGALAGSRDGLLGQIKLRVALQNTVRGSEQSLESGNAAAAQLRLKGEAVINRELGAKAANQIGRTPYADETALTTLRARWYERRPAGLPGPSVFNGKPPANLLVDTDEIAKSRALMATGSVPRVILGRPVAVSQAPLTFTLDPRPGRNLAIVGSASFGPEDDLEVAGAVPRHLALGAIGSCGLSLAIQHDPGSADFVVLDLLSEQDRTQGNVQDWLGALRKLGHEPTVIQHGDVKPWIADTASALSERTPKSRPMYVFGLGFEAVGKITERGGPGTVAPVKLLQNILENGPLTRLHSFFWWATGQTYLAHIEKKMETFFSGTLVLFGAEEVAQRVNDLTTRWQGAENRGLFRDTSGSQGKRKMIPYRPLAPDEFDQLIATVSRD